MPMEIEGTRWTVTRPLVQAPSALGAVATSSEKKVGGYLTSLRIESDQAFSAAEISLLFASMFQKLQLELVETPKFIIEDSPIWVWQVRKDATGKAIGYQAVLAAGVLKGHAGDTVALSDCTQVLDPKTNKVLSQNCKLGTPTTKSTAELPRYIMNWSVLTRPTNLESPASNLGNLTQAVRETVQPLRNIARAVVLSVKAVEVPVSKGMGIIVACAAAIGLALVAWKKGR